MTTLKEIKGIKVQSLTTNPTDLVEGQIWYNSTTQTFKGVAYVSLAGAWSSGGNLSTARCALAGAGTQTEGLAFGGTDFTGATEEYNGSTWTSGGNLGTARYNLAGAGTQTAGLAFGGYNGLTLNDTEEYNGTSWTAGGSLPAVRCGMGSAGTQTAGLGFGGYFYEGFGP